MHKTQILSAASKLPEQAVNSVALFEEIKSDTNYGIQTDWMPEYMGIHERRYAAQGTQPSQLATPAAALAIERSGINPSDIDLIIFCGIEKDHREPATAHTVAKNLKLEAKHAFDVLNACFGFADGMQIASNFVASGVSNYALVVTAELFSRPLMHLIDRLKKGESVETAKNALGFLSLGDAGGAMVIGRSLDGVTGFETFNMRTHSKEVGLCFYNSDDWFRGEMHMAKLSALMVKGHKQIIGETLSNAGWSNVDYVVSHQVGERPFERIKNIKGLKKSKMTRTYHKLGNIASATFPVNLEKLSLETDQDNDNMSKKRILFAGNGSGLVYGQILYTY